VGKSSFTGSRGFKKRLRGLLKYPVLPYPKGPTARLSGVVHKVKERKPVKETPR
jgi:hypothetical protein